MKTYATRNHKKLASVFLSVVLLATSLPVLSNPVKAFADEAYVKSATNTILGVKGVTVPDSLKDDVDDILFSSRTKDATATEAAEYKKFTLLEEDLSITASEATKVGNTVVIPYSLTIDDTNPVEPTNLTLLITDTDRTLSIAKIRYYGKLEAPADKTDANKIAKSGEVSFSLPDNYRSTDVIYILAEVIDPDKTNNDKAAISDEVAFKVDKPVDTGKEKEKEETHYTHSYAGLDRTSGVSSKINYVAVSNLSALTEIELAKAQATVSTATVQLDMKFKTLKTVPSVKLALYDFRKGGNRRFLRTEYLDISISKTVDDESKTSITETDEVLESVIDFSTAIYSPMVLRLHGGRVTKLIRLRMKPLGELTDGTFYYDTENKKLYLYSSQFSTFAIDYSIKDLGDNYGTVTIPGTGASETPKVTTVPVYRLYNPVTRQHFFTISTAEKESLVKNGWKNEGIAFNAPDSSDTPVYRLLNVRTGEHYFTVSAAEKNQLITQGWTYEYIAWYSDDAKAKKVYRLRASGKLKNVTHYTANVTEKEQLVKQGWTVEETGIFAK